MPVKSIERPRVYLDNVSFSGYKSIEDLSIDFKKNLNILIGKNGSGKSNFLEIINQTTRQVSESKLNYRFAKLEFVSDDHHKFTFLFQKETHFKINKEDLSDRLGLQERFLIDDVIYFDNTNDKDLRRRFKYQDRFISYKGIGRLFPNLGYKPVYPLFIKFNIPSNLDCIDFPGTLKAERIEDDFYFAEYPNTLTFIIESILAFESLFENSPIANNGLETKFILKNLNINIDVIKNLRLYSPIQDIKFNNNINVYYEDEDIIIENIKLDFKINNNWIPWSQLSDGTKRLFYIIAEITVSSGIILIEEPELGIHPHQFNLLMDFIKQESEDKQVIISTHSPKALDHLTVSELECILITNYDPKKGTQIRHLSNKEIIKAKKYMKEVGFFSDYWMLSDLE